MKQLYLKNETYDAFIAICKKINAKPEEVIAYTTTLLEEEYMKLNVNSIYGDGLF